MNPRTGLTSDAAFSALAAKLLMLAASSLLLADIGCEGSASTAGSGGAASRTDAGGGSGGTGGSPVTSGDTDASTGGGGGTGGSMQGTGGVPAPFPGCLPDTPPEVPDIGSDACLRCLAEQCCRELACGTVGTIDVRDENDAGSQPGPRYFCYEFFFAYTRDCFEREVAAGSSLGSDELLVQCGKEECAPMLPADFEFPHRNFLACLAGQPRPILKPGTNDHEYIEGEASDDAGTAPNCIAECLPSWR